MRVTPLGFVLAIAACGPTSDDSQGASEATTTAAPTTTASTTAAATTTAPTTGATEDCGPPPATPACDTGVTDPHAPLCGVRSQADCDGPLEADIECRWVETEIVAAEADACASSSPAGACIAVKPVDGDGCGGPPTRADTRAGDTLWRFTPQCDIEVFASDICLATVLGWNLCTWDREPDDACALPWPNLGPAACTCAC